MPVNWSLDIELHEWMTVPSAPRDVAEWRADVTALFELLAEFEFEFESESESEVIVNELVPGSSDYNATLDSLLEFAAALSDDEVLVVGLGLVGHWPLPVIVSVTATGHGLLDLPEAAGASGGLPIDRPTVDDIAQGDGIRVTRLDLDDDGALWATVACARQTGDVVVVLTWRTAQLELVPQFSPLLEELLAHVTIGSDA